MYSEHVSKLFALKWPLWGGYLGSWDASWWPLPLWRAGRSKVKTRVNVWTVGRDTKKWSLWRAQVN